MEKWIKVEIQEFPLKHLKTFYCEGAQTLGTKHWKSVESSPKEILKNCQDMVLGKLLSS